MDDVFIKNFSKVIKKLLSEDNKDKLLGEISEDLEQYIIDIKNMVDSGVLTYDQLRDEISKNLNISEDTKPGSVAQLLLGCIDEDSCPMRQEEIMDIPYYYDIETLKLIPLTNIKSSISKDSYAIIYITGNPKDISIDSLNELVENGFNKLKIMYKKNTTSKYKTLNIENLRKYVSSNPGLSTKGIIMISVLIAVLFVIIYKRY